MKHSLKYVTIAQASRKDHPRHSEPAMIELRDGSILIAWQEYLASNAGSEDNAPNRIAAMTSRDGGLTWGEHRVLVETPPGEVNVYSPQFIRSRDGSAILFFYFRYVACETGKPIRSVCQVRISRDEGRTFSDLAVVWNDTSFSCASAVVKRLRSGRLILPVSRTDGNLWSPGEHNVSLSLHSDDDGKTWHESNNIVDLPMRGSMEPHVEQLREGRVMMVMRTQLGAVFQSFSTDEGQTWSKPQTTGVRSPESCPELVRIPKTGDLMLVWNNSEYDMNYASHFGKRNPLSVAISSDEGVTWARVKNVANEPKLGHTNPVAFFARSGRCVLAWFEIHYSDKWEMLASSDMSLRSAVFDTDWLYT